MNLFKINILVCNIAISFFCVTHAQAIDKNCTLTNSSNSQEVRFSIAECFFNTDDFSTALIHYEQLAKEGFAPAENAMGFYYQFGIAGKPTDHSQAARLYKSAAKKGISDAMVSYGGLFMRGDGVKKNYNTAKYWFEKAANLNDANGFYSLGVLYQNGLGVKKDLQKARFYWKKSSDLGNELAKLLLKHVE